MLIHGSPLSVTLPSEPSMKDRFWYWYGASGRKYIHSVYAPGDCPPLPGAIFIAVKRQGPLRTVLAVGRFSALGEGCFVPLEASRLAQDGADEIHVHLLAPNPEVSAAVLADLQEAFADDDTTGSGDGPSVSLHRTEKV